MPSFVSVAAAAASAVLHTKTPTNDFPLPEDCIPAWNPISNPHNGRYHGHTASPRIRTSVLGHGESKGSSNRHKYNFPLSPFGPPCLFLSLGTFFLIGTILTKAT